MTNANQQSRMIKVHITCEEGDVVGGESFWADLINENDCQCVVRNILLDPNTTLDDIIEVKKGIESNNEYPWEFVKVIERKRYSTALRYSLIGDKDSVLNRFREIKKYFQQKDIALEGAVAGLALMAVPLSISEEHLKIICSTCPEKIELVFPEVTDSN